MDDRLHNTALWMIVVAVGGALFLLLDAPLQAQEAGGVGVVSSLSGLPAFLAYFCLSLIVVTAYVYVYTRITVHDEIELIRANVPGAAISLGLSLLGFAMPVASAVAHSANIIDCIVWSVIALIVQVIIYFLVRIPVPTCRSALPPARWRPPSGSAWHRSRGDCSAQPA